MISYHRLSVKGLLEMSLHTKNIWAQHYNRVLSVPVSNPCYKTEKWHKLQECLGPLIWLSSADLKAFYQIDQLLFLCIRTSAKCFNSPFTAEMFKDSDIDFLFQWETAEDLMSSGNDHGDILSDMGSLGMVHKALRKTSHPSADASVNTYHLLVVHSPRIAKARRDACMTSSHSYRDLARKNSAAQKNIEIHPWTPFEFRSRTNSSLWEPRRPVTPATRIHRKPNSKSPASFSWQSPRDSLVQPLTIKLFEAGQKLSLFLWSLYL